jgi:hypothetical protein
MEEDSNDHLQESEPYLMGMRIPCSVHSQVSKEAIMWATAAGVGAGVSRIGGTDGVSGGGGAPHVGPRAQAHLDTAEDVGEGANALSHCSHGDASREQA